MRNQTETDPHRHLHANKVIPRQIPCQDSFHRCSSLVVEGKRECIHLGEGIIVVHSLSSHERDSLHDVRRVTKSFDLK